MIQNFFIKKIIESKLKDLPKEEQEKVFKIVSENPELFKKIAEETQAEMKNGKGQMEAMMAVMRKYESDLKKAIR